MLVVLLFIGALFFTSPVKSGGLYDDDELDLSGGLGSPLGGSGASLKPEDGLYGPPPPPSSSGTEDDHSRGPNYRPESAIDQFKIGYGGTYYRKEGDQSYLNGIKPNSNHISFAAGASGTASSFDKPLDEYSIKTPLNINSLNVDQLQQLRMLVEAAEAIQRSGNKGHSNNHQGGYSGVVDISINGGPSVAVNHATLGPLNSNLRGASSSYNPSLEYGPPPPPRSGSLEVLQRVLNAQIKLNALKSDILSENLAKLLHHGGGGGIGPGVAYGPPVSNAYGPPAGHHNAVAAAALRLHPLFGKLEAVDANLVEKLLNKELQLTHLEKEKHSLITAAGHAALGSIREKEKLVNHFGQLGITNALNTQLHTQGPQGGYNHASGEKAQAIAIAEKAQILANKAAQLANQVNGGAGPEYNPNFAPVPLNQVPLNPIRPLEYGPPNNPPPPLNGGFNNNLGFNNGPAYNNNGYNNGVGQGSGGFQNGHNNGHNNNGNFGGPPVQEIITIHPIYSTPSSIKQVHNVFVKQDLNGEHYYGPAPGPDFSVFNGHSVVKGPFGPEHLSPHQRPGPYPVDDDLIREHQHTSVGYAAPPPVSPSSSPTSSNSSKVSGIVENVAKHTAKAIVGALSSGGRGKW